MTTKAPYSIRKRMLLSVMSLTAVFIIISLFFSYRSSHHEVFEVYDARLGQTAKLFLLQIPLLAEESPEKQQQRAAQYQAWMSHIRAVAEESDDEETIYGHPYEENLLVQLYQGDRMVWNSIPQMPEIPHDSTFSGFGDIQFHDGEWRFFQLSLPQKNEGQGKVVPQQYVIVAERYAVRREMMGELTLSTLGPQLMLIPCLVLAIYWLITLNFAPITELKAAILRRNVRKLDKIQVKHPTQEMLPLVSAINRLLSELESAWRREKRFTSMAAHELKTPLAILRLNTENALNADRPEALESDLRNVLRGIERADRLIQQLLTLARVENLRALTRETVNMQQVAQNVMRELAPLALRNHQEISLEGESFVMQGDESLLFILISNLVDNAIRYAGEGQQIQVLLKETPQQYQLWISDTGEDITPEAREKLFESFYRSNREKGDGAGLGLSITQDIVKLHQGSVQLLPRDQGCNTFLVSFEK